MNQVELIGTYGGDVLHGCSAWTSTSRDYTEERKARLGPMLKMLAENKHHTPFEKSMLHFLITADTASHIHILKHRIGVSVNAESARYKELKEDKFHIPEDWPEDMRSSLSRHLAESYKLYHEFMRRLTPTLGRKRAKESARFVLPYANQLTLDVSFNFRSFMHFIGLRYKSDAQLEICEIGSKMLDLIKETKQFDLSLAAFGY